MEAEFVEGQVLDGKYRIERVIGRGGMGVVVAARHLVLDESVAIKFLTEQALANSEAVARFEREARASVKIKSEHVVRVLDVGRLASGSPYMVMELLQGEDLAQRLANQGPLAVEQAVDFVLQGCLALAGAHAAGIVHRDIKPGNLFCVAGSDGQPYIKVLDFGISKLSEAALGSDSGLSVTKTSSVMGSPLYMSPEQVQSSKDVDERTDVWAIGVVLFELISGRVPFHGESFGEVAIKIATQPLPRLSSFRRDVPPGLDEVLGRCLEKDRRRRFSNVAELALALGRYASRRGQASVERITGTFQASASSKNLGSARYVVDSATLLAPDPETVSPWTEVQQTRSSKRALFGTGAAVLVLLAVGGVVLVRRSSSGASTASSTPPALSDIPLTAKPEPPVAVPPTPPSPPEPAVTLAPEPPNAESPVASAVPEPVATQPLVTRRSAPPRHTARPVSTASPAPARPAADAAPTAAARPAAPRPDCDPPYTLDDQGRKKFKPECFIK